MSGSSSLSAPDSSSDAQEHPGSDSDFEEVVIAEVSRSTVKRIRLDNATHARTTPEHLPEHSRKRVKGKGRAAESALQKTVSSPLTLQDTPSASIGDRSRSSSPEPEVIQKQIESEPMKSVPRARCFFFEYAASSRQACKSTLPASEHLAHNMRKGVLKFGITSSNTYSARSAYDSGVDYRSWGCVTAQQLKSLATAQLSVCSGFTSLSASDQSKIRKAIAKGRISSRDKPQESVPVNIHQLHMASQSSRKHSRNNEENGAGQSTQSEPGSIEEVQDVFYTRFKTEIKGIQYYRGLVGAGQCVNLRREPTNAFDKNAIAIINTSAQQIGHIPRPIAARLAPLIDQNLIIAEGIMIEGNMDRPSTHKYSLKMHVDLFGSPDSQEQLAPLLAWAKPLSSKPTGSQNVTGITGSNRNPGKKASRSHATEDSEEGDRIRSEALQRLLRQFRADKEDMDQKRHLTDLLVSKTDSLDLPLHPQPPSIANGLLTGDLLPHQSQALYWMQTAENPMLVSSPQGRAVQFWKKVEASAARPSYYLNLITNTPQSNPPTLGRGGILADDMGLGKTLSTLAFCLLVKNESQPPVQFNSTILIVCPLSVLSNWEAQYSEHVVPGRLHVHSYHGEGCNIHRDQLLKHDVILTTYQTLIADAKTAKPKLISMRWRCIVLDEGHVIVNPKTQVFRVCCRLVGYSRFVLSGTPIINTPKDFRSLLEFTKLCSPLDESSWWNRCISRPLSIDDSSGAEMLRKAVSSTTLRRSKDMKTEGGTSIVSLPNVQYHKIPVQLSAYERSQYNILVNESTRRMSEVQESGEAVSNFANVLALLTRLRQMTLHPALVPAQVLEDIKLGQREVNVSQGRSSPAETSRLQAILKQAIDDELECCICLDGMQNPRITPCAHIFCLECISQALDKQQSCPLDRYHLTTQDLIAAPTTEMMPEDTNILRPADCSSSSKINELLKYLRLMPAGDKGLIFSQFTGFLDLISFHLDQNEIPHCRFDGRMSAKARKHTLEQFNKPLLRDNPSKNNPKVMLLSLKCGALGLNLTAANHVFMMDVWWQRAIESQAIDRVNRLGQTKPVNVMYFIAEDTIESKVIEIQSKKEKVIHGAFSTESKHDNSENRAANVQARYRDLMQSLAASESRSQTEQGVA